MALNKEVMEQSDILVADEGVEIPAPEPGLYPDMNADHYHKTRAASASRLNKLRRSPAHLRHSLLHPEDFETDAKSLGRALHTYVLEPDRFSREFAIMPKFNLRTNLGKEARDHFELDNLGKSIIDVEELAICESVRDSLMSNKTVRSMLEAEGSVESSAFWRDPVTGLMCKVRPDKHLLFDGRLTVVDLKGMREASPDVFSRDILNYGYHVQAPFYLDGISAVLEENHTDFIFLAVEKTPPFAFGIYQLEDDAIELGRKEYRRLLTLYKECEDRGEWPGYGEFVQSINLPPWAFKN